MTSTAACALACSLTPAGLDSVNESHAYTLFNPTPRELMREMTTDRPDATESPFTIDAGHLQIETSFVDYAREGRSDAFTVMSSNFRLGVLENVEFALVIDPYVHVENEDTSAATGLSSDSGFGDLELRVKWNLWGNDGDKTAMALMPVVRLPTSTGGVGSNKAEPGLIVPFALELNDGWSLGLMAQFNGVHDPDRDRYDLEFIQTAALGFDIIDPLGGYVEYIGIASTAPSAPYQALIGCGLTYALNANWQLDVGINIGLTSAADDLNPFIGMAIRF